ncbi:MAG: hypothetical protein P4L55_04130, partial [Syntrophobacteraceae bacterium]|nr:hypothetical protein [Syntrophobacteraceae bacterium]
RLRVSGESGGKPGAVVNVIRSGERGAGSGEQGAGSREQEAGSREQEAGSGKQGAGRTEPLTLSLFRVFRGAWEKPGKIPAVASRRFAPRTPCGRATPVRRGFW